MAIPSIVLSAQGFVSSSGLDATYSRANINEFESPENVTFQQLDEDYSASLYDYVWFAGDYAYTLQLANMEATFRVYRSRINDTGIEVVLHSARSGTMRTCVLSGGFLFGDNGGFRLLTTTGTVIPLVFSSGTLTCAAMKGSDQIRFLVQVGARYVLTDWLTLGDLASTIPVPTPTTANAFAYVSNPPSAFLLGDTDLAINSMELNEYSTSQVWCNTADGPSTARIVSTPDANLRMYRRDMSVDTDGDGYRLLYANEIDYVNYPRTGIGSVISPTAVVPIPVTTLKYFWTNANKAVEDPATVLV